MCSACCLLCRVSNAFSFTFPPPSPLTLSLFLLFCSPPHDMRFGLLYLHPVVLSVTPLLGAPCPPNCNCIALHPTFFSPPLVTPSRPPLLSFNLLPLLPCPDLPCLSSPLLSFLSFYHIAIIFSLLSLLASCLETFKWSLQKQYTCPPPSLLLLVITFLLLFRPLSCRIFVVGIGFFSLCFLMTSLGGQFSAKRLGDAPFTIRTEGTDIYSFMCVCVFVCLCGCVFVWLCVCVAVRLWVGVLHVACICMTALIAVMSLLIAVPWINVHPRAFHYRVLPLRCHSYVLLCSKSLSAPEDICSVLINKVKAQRKIMRLRDSIVTVNG